MIIFNPRYRDFYTCDIMRHAYTEVTLGAETQGMLLERAIWGIDIHPEDRGARLTVISHDFPYPAPFM